MVEKVKAFMSQHQLLDDREMYLVALSGGADSVALLCILDALGINISAAHCNFHLRGEESNRDEQFCVDLCQKMGIPLSRIHFDTLEYAQLHKVSIEMAARDLRYRYFAQLAKDLKADGICVAHHRDDNVETLLLNLLRGSGIDGLAGIAPQNGNILRPLLCISRQDILQYLKEKGQDYVTDSTNLEDDALRNKIRHHVIPLLQTLNPAASDNIALSAKYVRQACEMLSAMGGSQQHQEGTEEEENPQPNTLYINKVEVMQAASPEFMLHHQIGSYGFHGDCIDSIIEAMEAQDGGVGKVWKSNGHMLAIDRDSLLITSLHHLEACQQERSFRIPEEGNYHIGNLQLRIKQYEKAADFQPSKSARRITLDADKVNFPLVYRRTETGDRFQPFGMKGSKLVSDYLTDRKRSYLQKLEQHVITHRDGDIIWLVGERTSEKTKITEQTQTILEIEIKDYEQK